MYRIVLAVVLFIIAVGFVCPTLISMKSDIAVIIGIVVLSMTGFSVYHIIKPLLRNKND